MNDLTRDNPEAFDLRVRKEFKLPCSDNKKAMVTNTFVHDMNALNKDSEALKADMQIIASCVDKGFSLQDWLEIKQFELDRMMDKKQKLIDKNCEFWAGQTNA